MVLTQSQQQLLSGANVTTPIAASNSCESSSGHSAIQNSGAVLNNYFNSGL
jgi:hypothetical protein